MVGMASYLQLDMPKKRIDLDVIADFAKEAARNFLKDKVPLNSSIVKIAQAENLTPEAVSLVVADANKAVHESLFKVASDKYIDFDLADPKQVLDELQGNETEKTASVFDKDYQSPPSYSESTAFEKTASFGEHYSGHKMTLKQEAHYAMEKLSHRASRLDDDILVLNSKIASQEHSFIKIARNMLLTQDFSDRPKAFPFLLKFAMDAGLAKQQAKTLVTKLAHVMQQQGVIEKTAASEAPESLISDEVAKTTKVTNGDHPLYILINTLGSDYDRRDMLDRDANITKTKLKDLKEKVKVL